MNNARMGKNNRIDSNFISLRKPGQSSQVSNTQVNRLLDIYQSSVQEYARYCVCLIKRSIIPIFPILKFVIKCQNSSHHVPLRVYFSAYALFLFVI